VTRVIAIDTSTWWGSVALVEGGGAERAPRVVAEHGRRIDDSHAEHVLDWVERCLSDAGWTKSSVDLYAATRGPGSFTGIRVALGTVRGLGLATGRPCAGVTTLLAVAATAGDGSGPRVPVMDAGRAELYAACYEASTWPPEELAAPWIAAAVEVLADAGKRGAEIVTGPGTNVDLPQGAGAAKVIRAPERLAGAAGRIAVARHDDGTPPEPFSPLYLRPPDAVLKRKRR